MPKLTDTQVMEYIANHYSPEFRSASTLLSHFRKHKIMACEQKRFKRLFDNYLSSLSSIGDRD